MASDEEPSLHCNACGRKVPIRLAMGRRYGVCSAECIREMEWRHTLYILRKPYRPSPETEAMAKRVLEEEDEGAPRERGCYSSKTEPCVGYLGAPCRNCGRIITLELIERGDARGG